jgi:hypothetical protein
MTLERDDNDEASPLKAIHVIFEAVDGRSTRLTFTPDGVLYRLLTSPLITDRSVQKLISEPAAPSVVDVEDAALATTADDGSGHKEREPIVTVTGRLKNKPREGRPDRNGRPTAWTVLATHEEDSEQAKMYSATFHRHTTAIALNLAEGAQVTVQGYARASSDSSRMDSLSVFNIPHYPGKQEKQS